MITDERDPARGVEEQRVGLAVPAPRNHLELASAGSDARAVMQANVRVEALRCRGDVVPERLDRSAQRIRHAVGTHELARESAICGDVLGVGRAVRGRRIERRDPCAGPALDRRREPDVVVVVMGRDHELDVLDLHPAQSQASLERIERFVGARPRVDQRDGVAAQQPRVDRPDVRQRNGDCIDSGHGSSS